MAETPGELAALGPDEIVIEGLIVDENVGRAPRCALHPVGKRDPVDCAPEILAFWLADDAAPNAPRIRVLGWSSRFSEIVEVRRLALGAPSGGKPKTVRRDDLWDVPVPWPLPTSGKRVRVRGTYAPTFAKSSDRVVDEPATGILTYRQLDYL